MGRRMLFGLKRQRGQAWAEFVVTASFVIVPLVILVPTMGKYLDSKQKVEQAARYAAWERTVWYQTLPSTAPVATQKSDAAVLNEAQQRVFATRTSPIFTQQSAGDPNFEVDPLQNFVYGASGKYEPIFKEKGDAGEGQMRRYVDHATDEINTPGLSGAFEEGLGKLESVPYFNAFDVGRKGTYTATVSVDLQVPERIAEFSQLDLKLSRSVTLVAEGWNAGGPKHNHDRVRALVPLGLLDFEAFKMIQGVLEYIPPFQPLSRLRPGWVDVEPVPLQYLE